MSRGGHELIIKVATNYGTILITFEVMNIILNYFMAFPVRQFLIPKSNVNFPHLLIYSLNYFIDFVRSDIRTNEKRTF